MTDLVPHNTNPSNPHNIQDTVHGVPHTADVAANPYSELTNELTWCAAEANHELNESKRFMAKARHLAVLIVATTYLVHVFALLALHKGSADLAGELIGAFMALVGAGVTYLLLSAISRAQVHLSCATTSRTVEVQGRPVEVRTVLVDDEAEAVRRATIAARLAS